MKKIALFSIIIIVCSLFTITSYAEIDKTYYNDAVKYFAENDYENALYSIESHIHLNPTDYESYFLKAEILEKLNSYSLAVESIDIYLNENPLNQEAHYKKSIYLYLDKKFEESIDSFNKTIELGDNYIYAYMYKSKAQAYLEKFDEAVATCTEAISLFPDSYELYYTKGLILGKNNQYSEALDEFNNSIEINKDYSPSYFGKSLCLNFLEQYEESKFIFREGYDINPDFGYSLLKSFNENIILEINNPNMTVNGKEKEIDPGRYTTPTIVNNRTLLPVRALIESLGGNIEWIDSEKKVLIELNNQTIELFIDKDIMKANGEPVKMDVSPQIINSRTMMPIRFLAENLGYDVYWYDKTKSVIIPVKYFGYDFI